MGRELPRRLCGGAFGEGELEAVREEIAAASGCSRAEVSRRVCARLEWINEQGRLKEMSGRVALLALQRAGWIELPEARNRNGNGRSAAVPAQWPAPVARRGSVEELRGLQLRRVEDKASSLLWNALIERYHYIGTSRLSGAQVRYLIEYEQGVLGAIGFGAAALKLAVRERWIGWTPAQRQRQRPRVVNNRRFLILPWIEVRNLASHVLALSARAVVRDYEQLYGLRPVLLETFVEAGRFSGCCYRAANWQHIGHSVGRGRGDRAHRGGVAIKAVYVYPLTRHCRAVLTEAVG